MKTAVIGSGGWGTALSMVLCKNGHEVTLWSHSAAQTEKLRQIRQNPRLEGVTLPEGIEFSSDPACAGGKDLVVLATPSFGVRETAKSIAPYLGAGTVMVSVAKGIEPGTCLRMSEIVAAETGRVTAALSGPTHAEEVSRYLPTGCVAACGDCATAEFVQDAFMNEVFRVYTSPDVTGIELGGALKNVIAIAAGAAIGAGYGDSARASRICCFSARVQLSMGRRTSSVISSWARASRACSRTARQLKPSPGSARRSSIMFSAMDRPGTSATSTSCCTR